MTRRLPRLAQWLAEHFIRGTRRDSVLGDLCEAFQQGRSRLWFWRQVIAAIVAGILQSGRTGWRPVVSWTAVLPVAFLSAISAQIVAFQTASWLFDWMRYRDSEAFVWGIRPVIAFLMNYVFVSVVFFAAPSRKRQAAGAAFVVVVAWFATMVRAWLIEPAPIWVALIGLGGLLGGAFAFVFARRQRATTTNLLSLKLNEWRGLPTLFGIAWAVYIFIALTLHQPPVRFLFMPMFTVFVWGWLLSRLAAHWSRFHGATAPAGD